MKWRGRRTSANIEDRRGGGGRGGLGGRGGGMFGSRGGLGGGMPGGRVRLPMPRGRGGRRAGGASLVMIAVVVVLMLMGVDVTPFLGGGGGGFAPVQQTSTRPAGPNVIDDANEEFVAVVLAETEQVWGGIFEAEGQRYPEPRLVLFDGRTTSACGPAQAATGPFYCPVDRMVYLDMSFFQMLEQRLGAAGDFARAYVIAHEVGHHVQNLTGVLEAFHEQRGRLSTADANALSVRVELQADCYAGLWGRLAADRLQVTEADVAEALTAAERIGDDALQRMGGGAVRPDSFTHGSSEQRMRWFRTGFETGDWAACDTFSADRI